MRQIEHPAYKEEDLAINTPEELEEAKKEAGVTTWKEARKRYLEENILSPEEIDEIVVERFAKEFLKGNSERILEARETYDMSDDLLRSAISRAIKQVANPEVAPDVLESIVHDWEKNDSVENISNLFSSISDKEFHDSLEKSIKDYFYIWIKRNMPPLNIQHSTISGSPVKSHLADLEPETYKKRHLEDTVRRMKEACEGHTAIALIKILKIFFGEEISKSELENELVGKVTATFLDNLKKEFDEHMKNIKSPTKYGQLFPSYYSNNIIWERLKKIKDESSAQKTEETLIQESIQELKKDYENCAANVNQIRQEFSLPPL